jgi:hypothetical protein
VLSLGAQKGIAVAPQEWAKFFYLERHARRRAELLHQAFAA